MDHAAHEQKGQGSWPFRFPKIARDSVLFGLGLVFAVNEVIVREVVRVEVLIFSGGLLGLPLAFLADDLRARLKSPGADE